MRGGKELGVGLARPIRPTPASFGVMVVVAGDAARRVDSDGLSRIGRGALETRDFVHM